MTNNNEHKTPSLNAEHVGHHHSSSNQKERQLKQGFHFSSKDGKSRRSYSQSCYPSKRHRQKHRSKSSKKDLQKPSTRNVVSPNLKATLLTDSGTEAGSSSTSWGSSFSDSSTRPLEMNLCSNTDKHLISCEHHERFNKQFHSEALCCKCRPRLEMEKMSRNQQAAMMQQKVLGAAGLNFGGQIQNSNLPLQGNASNSTGQTIVNGVLKVFKERTSQSQNPNTNFSAASNFQSLGPKTGSVVASMSSSDSHSSKASSPSFSTQKRCDYNCPSCQTQCIKSSNELYPGATPPPNLLSLIGAFGDFSTNSRISGFQDNTSFSNNLNLGKPRMNNPFSFGNSQKASSPNGNSFNFGSGASSSGSSSGNVAGYTRYQQMTEPRYPSPFASKPGFGFSQQSPTVVGPQQFSRPTWSSSQTFQPPKLGMNRPGPTPPAFHFRNVRSRF